MHVHNTLLNLLTDNHWGFRMALLCFQQSMDYSESHIFELFDIDVWNNLVK